MAYFITFFLSFFIILTAEQTIAMRSKGEALAWAKSDEYRSNLIQDLQNTDITPSEPLIAFLQAITITRASDDLGEKEEVTTKLRSIAYTKFTQLIKEEPQWASPVSIQTLFQQLFDAVCASTQTKLRAAL